jgi:hypothetical protein
MRLTKVNYSLTILVSLVSVYYIPAYAMFHWPSLHGRDGFLFFWQMSPIWVSLTTRSLSFFIADTTYVDRMIAPKRDLPIMRYTIGTLSTFSAGVWLWTCITSPYSFTEMFVPAEIPSQANNLKDLTREFLKVDEMSLFGCTFLWLGFLFWDLKSAGMISTSWIEILLRGVVSIAFIGPGATTGLGWLWREDAITNRRHEGAMTEERAKQFESRGSKVKTT